MGSNNPSEGSERGLRDYRIVRLLLAIARGGTLEEAASEAGLEPGAARIIVAALASQGLVMPASGPEECPCDRCPLHRVCGGRIRPRNRGEGYVLTEKGRRLLASLLRSKAA